MKIFFYGYNFEISFKNCNSDCTIVLSLEFMSFRLPAMRYLQRGIILHLRKQFLAVRSVGKRIEIYFYCSKYVAFHGFQKPNQEQF